MSATVHELHGARPMPLVAVVCRVPMLGEALSAALDGIAEVRVFPSRPGETAKLLHSLSPDAAVVDDPLDAQEVAALPLRSYSPVVHVSLRPPAIRVLRDGVWEEAEGDSLSPETLRNIIVAGLFGKRRR
ncbi:MAG: hypothetical protein QOG93_1616 [Gaiellaceae bacterium]|nr:hypothetical protein [Gaiellaceae bacterium]